MLLEPVPYPDRDRLVQLITTSAAGEQKVGFDSAISILERHHHILRVDGGFRHRCPGNESDTRRRAEAAENGPRVGGLFPRFRRTTGPGTKLFRPRGQSRGSQGGSNYGWFVAAPLPRDANIAGRAILLDDCSVSRGRRAGAGRPAGIARRASRWVGPKKGGRLDFRATGVRTDINVLVKDCASQSLFPGVASRRPAC